MIVNDLPTAKRYLPSVNLKVGSALLDFLESAQDFITEKILGDELATFIESENCPEKWLKKAQRAISVTAYLKAAQELDLQLSEAGFVVQSNDLMQPASQHRTEALFKSLKARQTTALDDLLRYLLKEYAEIFPDWSQSEQFIYFTSTPIATLECLRNHEPRLFNTLNNAQKLQDVEQQRQVVQWLDFWNAVPRLQMLLQDVAAEISWEYTTKAVELLRDGEHISELDTTAIEYIRFALVAFYYDKKDEAQQHLYQCRKLMTANGTAFPEFINSDVFKREQHNAGKGQISNFL